MNFEGYQRKNGTFGVRNHVLIFPTIICASAVADMINRAVPDTVCISHPHGCGHMGPDKEHMIRAMAGFCSNPNVAGVLLVGNGCELITPEVIAEELAAAGQRFEIVSVQAEGGTTGAVEKGRLLAKKLLKEAAGIKRRQIDISELIMGVKCGGSDTLSGLTANPALGKASDLLIGEGGTVIMSEVPEMLGAEQVLVRRAADDNVKNMILKITSDMEAAILQMGVDVRGSEPSPGNIEGGLTTLEEKSLGAIHKGGTTSVREVVKYAEKPSKNGLVIMDGPALDAVCLTGLSAAGAQIIVFTTGRGTPLGSAIAPVIKISSNNLIYERMKDNIDINAGTILNGSDTIESVGEKIFDDLILTASGKISRSEILGHREFAVHTIGPAV